MNTYRLMIHQRDRLLGHFESGTPYSEDAIKTIATSLNQCEGYRLELLVACGEKRLVESTSQGVRLLYSELLFKPFSLDEL
ncbi:MAG: cytoplasmic protein [Burkholderiaceae bacterium]|jgi:hypothetical protein|nr:cytoplasmic protein [Burkholderiaceae bacterium]